MRDETKGVLFALLAAAVSGISIPVNKLFIVSIDPTVFTAVRAVIIGIAFLAIALLQSRLGHSKFRKTKWSYLLAIAVIGGSFAFLLFFNGLALTTAGMAAFLQKTLPLYTAVLAFVFLREKITRKMSLALAAMLVGTLMVSFAQISPSGMWLSPSLGDALVIGATVLWAVEAVLARKVMRDGETNFVVSFARMLFGGIILMGVVLLLGKSAVLLALSFAQVESILVSAVLLFLYVLFWYWSIRYINVSKATSLLLVAPIISLAGGILMFGEPAPLLQLAGSAVILVGAYLVGGVKSEVIEKL